RRPLDGAVRRTAVAGGPLFAGSRPDDLGRRSRGVSLCHPTTSYGLLEQGNRAAGDLRRSSGDRDSERAPFQGTRRTQQITYASARATNGNERNPAGDQ